MYEKERFPIKHPGYQGGKSLYSPRIHIIECERTKNIPERTYLREFIYYACKIEKKTFDSKINHLQTNRKTKHYTTKQKESKAITYDRGSIENRKDTCTKTIRSQNIKINVNGS